MGAPNPQQAEIARVEGHVGAVVEPDRKAKLEAELTNMKAQLALSKLPASKKVEMLKQLAGIGTAAEKVNVNFQAESDWMDQINNVDPTGVERGAEEAWMGSVPATKRERLREVLASSNPQERNRLLLLKGDYRRQEFDRLIALDDAARQSEQDIASGGMTAQERELVDSLPQSDQQAFIQSIRSINPNNRPILQATIATLSDSEKIALSKMSQTKRVAELVRMQNQVVSNFDNRRNESQGNLLSASELAFMQSINDNALRIAEQTRMNNMSSQERGEYKALLTDLEPSQMAIIGGLTEDKFKALMQKLPSLNREQRLNELGLLGWEDAGIKVDFTDIIRKLPDSDQEERLDWINNALVPTERGFLNHLTETERLRILNIPNVNDRTAELRRLIGLGPVDLRTERSPDSVTGPEETWLRGVRVIISPNDSMAERRKLAAMTAEQRAAYQAKLVQVRGNGERIWLMGDGAANVEQKLDQLLAMSDTERNELNQRLNQLGDAKLAVWYCTLPEGERDGAFGQLANLTAAQRNNILGLSYAQIRHFTGLPAGERFRKLQEYYALSDELKNRDKINKSMAEMPAQLRQDVQGRLNDLFNYDQISPDARKAIVDTDSEWDRVKQEFPDHEIDTYRDYLKARSKTEVALLTAGENAFDSLADVINDEYNNGRISANEHDVMRLKLEIYNELKNPSENLLERLVGPDVADWFRDAGANIKQAWPVILLALIMAGGAVGGGYAGGLAIDGAFSVWGAVGGGSLAMVIRANPTYRNYQRAKTSKKLIQLAQAERRVTLDKLETYEDKVLGGMEVLAERIKNGVNPQAIKDTEPELYQYLVGLGVMTQDGSVQAESVIQNLLQFGSDHAKQVQKLEQELDKRRAAIKKQKTKADILKEANKSVGDNINVGGNIAPSFA